MDDVVLNSSSEVLGQSNVVGRSTHDNQAVVRRLESDLRLGLMFELSVIFLATLFVTRAYLNLNPRITPIGGEFGGAIVVNQMWTLLRGCGACFMWYGGIAGGMPAFAEPTGSQLYPVVALATFIFGVYNGAKLALVASFFTAAFAQWWLARVLGIGWVGRLWSALMALVAAHIAVRLLQGAFSVAISIAACSLIFAPLLTVTRTGHRRDAVVLGLISGLAAISGVLYVQPVFIYAAPAILLLLRFEGRQLRVVLQELLIALLIAVLLSMPLIVPFLHFLPQFAKDGDPNFTSAQPFQYVPLNLVIKDPKFIGSEVLGKSSYAAHNVNYVGWAAVLLAVVGFGSARTQRQGREIIFLALFILIALWSAAAGPQALLYRLIPVFTIKNILAGARFVSWVAAIAVPPLLALSALGVDRLWNLAWPRVKVGLSLDKAYGRSLNLALDFRWLLFIPLFLALNDAYSFSRQWLTVIELRPEDAAVLEALRTPDLQWVATPYGEGGWMAFATTAGLKLARNHYFTWSWRGRAWPEPVLEATRGNVPQGMTQMGTVSNLPIFQASGREYAVITTTEGGRTVCTAQGVGGDIDVVCNAPTSGRLTVKENSWEGWQVAMDGNRVALDPGTWLTVDVPGGEHRITFRYRPWDVPVGVGLAALGLLLAAGLWVRGRPTDEAVAA